MRLKTFLMGEREVDRDADLSSRIRFARPAKCCGSAREHASLVISHQIHHCLNALRRFSSQREEAFAATTMVRGATRAVLTRGDAIKSAVR